MAPSDIAAFLLAQLATVGTATPADKASVSPNPQPDSTYVSLETTGVGGRTRFEIYGRNFLHRPSPEDPQDDSHDGGAFWVERHDGFYRLANIGIFVSQPGRPRWKFRDLDCQRLEVNEDTHTNLCKREGTGQQVTSIVSRTRGVLSFTGFCWLTASRLCNYVLVSERGIPHP